jgi:hypothetical protein
MRARSGCSWRPSAWRNGMQAIKPAFALMLAHRWGAHGHFGFRRVVGASRGPHSSRGDKKLGDTMEKLWGAIAAAVLLGMGCAHEQAKPTRTETPTPPRATVDGAGQGQTGGEGHAGAAHGSLSCEVIDPRASMTQRSETAQNECEPTEVSGSATEDHAMGGSALVGQEQQDAALNESEAGEVSGDAPEDSAIGGSASEIDGSASEDEAFESTDMGGTGGGGG